jgi:predicted membrane channel-forming protein YqfA (hemolysin III family)
MVFVSIALSGVVIVGTVWMLSTQSRHRKLKIRYLVLLAMAGVLITEAITNASLRWLNVAAAALMVCLLAVGFVWDRRRRRTPTG